MPVLSFDAATTHLSAADSDLAALIARIGPCNLQVRLEREPYEALISAIAHQQLHGRAAKTILGRFVDLYPETPFPSPAQVLATDENTLRGCGFSFSKIAAIHDIAAKTLDGTVPSRSMAETLPDEVLISQLTTLRGVGRWTVEMLLIFTLGRPDILPVDDFGVREGWRLIKAEPLQVKPKVLAEMGQAWSPYRSTAAWYLWQATQEGKLAPATITQ